MSISQMAAVWHVRGLSAEERSVLFAIAACADDDGWYGSGEDLMTERLDITPRTMRRHVSKLEGRGLLTVGIRRRGQRVFGRRWIRLSVKVRT